MSQVSIIVKELDKILSSFAPKRAVAVSSLAEYLQLRYDLFICCQFQVVQCRKLMTRSVAFCYGAVGHSHAGRRFAALKLTARY